MDEERLLPGHDWELEIAHALGASDVVIVCLSAASVGKIGYVQKELRRILDLAEHQPERRLFVIPLRLEPCELPLRLSHLQHADLFAEGGYERLLSALQVKVGENLPGPAVAAGPRQPPSTPHPHRRLSLSNTAAIATITIVLMGAGIALVALYDNSDTRAATNVEKSEAEVNPADMIRIPAGTYLMGRNNAWDPEASPAHEVNVSAFYIDRLPVTRGEFRDFMQASKRPDVPEWRDDNPLPDQDKWPATEVTWDEAYAFCHARGKRLPSEAEWEYAARGTDGRLYPWGEEFNPAAVNSRESGIGRPEPVGARPANRSAFDVADMSGNVWQWCADDYRPYPGRKSDFTVPSGAKSIRGGSFWSDRRQVSAITRNLELPGKRSPVIGFRCAQ
jgi:serine/threonine-protein kinase